MNSEIPFAALTMRSVNVSVTVLPMTKNGATRLLLANRTSSWEFGANQASKRPKATPIAIRKGASGSPKTSASADDASPCCQEKLGPIDEMMAEAPEKVSERKNTQ